MIKLYNIDKYTQIILHVDLLNIKEIKDSVAVLEK